MVEHIKSIKLIDLHLFHNLVELGSYPVASDILDNARGKKRNQCVLQRLVFDNWAFQFTTDLGRKLTSDARVSDNDLERNLEEVTDGGTD